VFGTNNIIRANHLENQLMMLSPNDFPSIEYYLSQFKKLRLVYIECQLDISEYRCIYVIISNLGSAYSIYLSTFYDTREDLGSVDKKPSFQSFCESMI
jgi:hypothetical protein